MQKKALLKQKGSLWQSINREMSEYPSWAVEGGIGFCIGLLAGFIARNFGTVVLIVGISLIGGLWLLDAFGLIVIRAAEIKAMLGLSKAYDMRSCFEIIKTLMQEHYSAAIGGSIGFLVGWKVGR